MINVVVCIAEQLQQTRAQLQTKDDEIVQIRRAMQWRW
jgi:hypothetical protein